MKKLSLQWRLTLITTLFIAIICGCLTMFVYGSGVYYMDSLQETVDAQNTDGDDSHQNEIYISIPDDKWDDFANDFSVQVYNNKADYKRCLPIRKHRGAREKRYSFGYAVFLILALMK